MIPHFLLHIQRHNPHYALNVDSTDQILQQTCVVPTNFHSNKSTHYFKNTYQDQTELKLITLHHIAIHQEYWGLGIGSAMFAELISAAKANPSTEILELEFIEGNDRARALYEKYGFEIVGERPNAFKYKDGSFRKEFFMQKKL